MILGSCIFSFGLLKTFWLKWLERLLANGSPNINQKYDANNKNTREGHLLCCQNRNACFLSWKISRSLYASRGRGGVCKLTMKLRWENWFNSIGSDNALASLLFWNQNPWPLLTLETWSFLQHNAEVILEFCAQKRHFRGSCAASISGRCWQRSWQTLRSSVTAGMMHLFSSWCYFADHRERRRGRVALQFVASHPELDAMVWSQVLFLKAIENTGYTLSTSICPSVIWRQQ